MLTKARWMVACAAGLTVALAGCGGDSSSSGGGEAGASTTSNAASGVVAEARANLDKVKTTANKLPITEPLAKSVKGKRIVYAVPSIPVAKTIGNRIDEAAKALGMTVKQVSIGATPDSVAAGMNEVVRAKPDGVIIVAFGPEFYKKQAAALKQAGVPVVGIGFNSCDDYLNACNAGETGVTAMFYGPLDGLEYGKLMADAVISDSGGKAHVALFDAPDLSFSKPIRQGFKDELAKCGDCSLKPVGVSVQSIGTKLPSQIVSYLQSHPDIKYLAVQYGDFAIGVPQALKAAGITDVKLVTQASSAPQFKDIENGGIQIADFPAAYGYFSYLGVDTIARVLAKQKIDDADQLRIPYHYMTKDNLEVTDGGYWPGIKDYRAQFTKLWSSAGG